MGRGVALHDWESLVAKPGDGTLSGSIPAANIKLKRAYDMPARDDGFRVLIDRLWPRGLPKDKAAVDQWLKEIAPSTELRKWFGHEPARWQEFRQRYAAEVHEHAELLEQLRSMRARAR